MNHDDTPEADAELALLVSKDALLSRVVVQSELDREADEPADQTPESATLSLGEMSEVLCGKSDTYLCVKIPVQKDERLKRRDGRLDLGLVEQPPIEKLAVIWPTIRQEHWAGHGTRVSFGKLI